MRTKTQNILEGLFLLTLIMIGSDFYKILPENFTPGVFKNDTNKTIFIAIQSLANKQTEFDREDIFHELSREYRKVIIQDYYSVRDTKPLDKVKFVEAANELIIRRLAETVVFTMDSVKDVLDLTIKKDGANKLITFLSYITAFTDDSQLNIMLVGPSSSGKTYMASELAKLFPPDGVMQIGYCSPTAFFHEAVKKDEETDRYIVNLERKIIIFLDQPHFELIERLRPMLSHDQKELELKITDRNEKDGLRTKNITIVGFPVVVFCTANYSMDEQEATRFFVVCPEINSEKSKESLDLALRKGTDPDGYNRELDSNEMRRLLMTRIVSIRDQKITDVRIGSPDRLTAMFHERCPKPQPRSSRDVRRLMGLVKGLALLNYPHRERQDSVLVANNDDIDAAFILWDVISGNQSHNVSPHIYRFHTDVIVPISKEKNQAAEGSQVGITRDEVLKKQKDFGGFNMTSEDLRLKVLPELEAAGIISQEEDPDDGRRQLIKIIENDEKI